MATTKRVLLLAGVALLVMATLFGCSLLLRDGSAQNSWHIKLNINNPSAAKGITVNEYDVTALAVEVHDPYGALIEEISWQAADGQRSYLIPVSEQGQHEIVVTHISDDNGEIVEAEESALFNIQAMVITVIDIIPGCIGVINVESGDEEPQTPIDLTGTWDWFWTPTGGSETGPVMLAIMQTDSTLVTDLFDFSGSISGSIFNLNSVEFGTDMTGTVSGSGDEIEITGTITSDFLGNGTFRIVPTAAIWGTLEVNGMVEGIQISVDSEFALGSGGEPDHRYEYTFPLTVGWFTGDVWLQTSSELTVKTYTVGDEPHYDDEISVTLWPSGGDEMRAIENTQVVITKYDSSGIAGSFDLEFGDGSTLFFIIPYEVPVTPSNTNSWTFTGFEVGGGDDEFDPSGVDLWFHVTGVLAEGQYIADQWWLSIDWIPPSAPDEEFQFHINDTGTLNITRFVENDGIAGTFDALGDTLTGSFNVYFYEEWEPEDD